MRRLLLCLPLCLLMAPSSLPTRPAAAGTAEPDREAVTERPDALPDSAAMEQLARTDPVQFLHQCLRYYERNVAGYHLVMQKRERIDGKERPPEEIEVWFRERPYAVHLHWLKGARLAQRAVYVAGENDGQMLVLPAGWRRLAGVVARDPDGPDARQSGRFSIKEYGLKNGLLRALRAWEAAQEAGQLHVEYLGERKLPEAGDRECLGLHRTRFAHPEEDGVADQTLWFDRDTWLLAGSLAKDANGGVIGEYWFRDVQLNPKMDDEIFTRESLK